MIYLKYGADMGDVGSAVDGDRRFYLHTFSGSEVLGSRGTVNIVPRAFFVAFDVVTGAECDKSA